MNNNAPNFGRLARAYRWMEYLTFGPLLERCRFAQLPSLTACRSALVLGDGDGRFLARLLAQNPALHATAVDASPAMLRRLAQNCIARSPDALARLTLVTADIRTYTPRTDSAPFDLIVTHFFLDCLSTEEVAALAARLAPHLALHVRWLVSEFALPANPLLRLPAQLLIRMLYAAFALLTGLRVNRLPDHPRALAAAGWSCRSRRTFAAGLLVSELWQR